MKSASEIQIWVCDDPECHGIHIRLFDENDEEFAQCVIPVNDIDDHISGLRDAESVVKGKTRH